MMTKPEFIYLANCMFVDAVEAMAYDLGMYPHGELSEPAHTAAIVTKFPPLMNKHWGGAKFAGCYIHQSPYVKMYKVSGRNECEAGDLLCICKNSVNGRVRLNAALFQLKKDKSKKGSVRPDNARQLRLYSEWPVFSFVQDLRITGDNTFDIKPKTVTSGAQYMFINKRPYPGGFSRGFKYGLGYPVVFTHAVPAPIMENDTDASFGSFLWDFIHWQNGRSFSDSISTANDDWSRLIWELIERSKKHLLTINKGKAHQFQAQRFAGDAIAFLTKMTSGLYDDISCQEDVSYIHSLFGDNTEGKKDVESSKKLNTEGCDGISILYIDLEHDDKIEVEG